MAPVERRYLPDAQPLGGRHDGRVHRAQWKVPVFPNELCHAQPVRRGYRLGRKCSGREVTQEPDLGFRSESRLDEVGNLRDDQDGNHQRPFVCQHQIQARLVMAVVLIDVGVQRPRIDG